MAGETTTTFANSMLLLFLQGAAITNIAQNGTSPLTTLYLSLHTADPTAAGTQTSSEVSYTGYARAPVARSSAGFTVASNAATLTAAISFGACTAGTATATYFGLGTLLSGAGVLWYAGPITPNISISNGVTPQLTTATSITIN
jgi:hypothetical protein